MTFVDSLIEHSDADIVMGEHDDDAPIRALQGRLFTALFPALDKLQVFAAGATPRERARMFEPS